ncbi:hypothetical protein [uncultured Bifidobacterium sp.]|uniref:hypothetical protein n=1 Tax=uncultured Bifidobacterium sp. TaxID=165187 RepID=UPI0025DFC864|nr:hypothetical protein [uncultured Bifidobacterium sp.]
MSDRVITCHRLACDWPDCEETAQDDLYDGSATYEQAVSEWAYLPDEQYDDFSDKDFLHDPATGKDYCPYHWHYDWHCKKWPHRVPGPDPEEQP